MTRPLLLLDLDGPLLDVSYRYHHLHQELLQSFGKQSLSYEYYWSCKRERVPERDILKDVGLSELEKEHVLSERLRKIETRELLAYDRLWSWSIPTLQQLSKVATVVIVTQRTYADRVTEQLQELQVMPWITQLISGRGDNTLEAKVGLVRDAGLRPSPNDVIVGDTEVDICSGKALGMRTVAVRTGIRSESLQQEHHPDVILDNLAQLAPWLTSIGWVL